MVDVDVDGGKPTLGTLSAREVKLLESFTRDHLYLLREIVGSDKNSYKYVRMLEQKGLIEQTSDPSHLGIDPLTHGQRVTRVQLTERGRALREVLERIALRRKFEQSDFLFLTENDTRLLAQLARTTPAPENLNELGKVADIPATSLYSSLTRLRALDLISPTTYAPTADGIALGEFLHADNKFEFDAQLTRAPPSSPEGRLEAVEELVIRAREVLHNILYIAPHDTTESILIVSDKKNHHIGAVFAYACEMLGVEPNILTVPDLKRPGVVPPVLEHALDQATVLIAATSQSITWTAPVLRRVKSGKLRAATLPASNLDFLRNAVVTDPVQLRAIEDATREWAAILRRATSIEIQTRLGTYLKIERELGDPVVSQLGRCPKTPEQGEVYPTIGITNLIGGEVFLEPRNVNGRLVLPPGTLSTLQTEAAVIDVVDGDSTLRGAVAGSDQLAAALAKSAKSRQLSSINFGTNPFVALGESRLADAKVRGGVNVGFGNNAFVYGNNDEPTVEGCHLAKTEVVINGKSTYHLDADRRSLQGPGIYDPTTYIA